MLQKIHDDLYSLTSYIVNMLSFNAEIEALVDALNHKLEEPLTKVSVKQFSHPGGFVRELTKRRLSMASSIIKIAHDLSPEDVEDRLAALRMLMDQSYHAKTLNMPLNTARVQIQLMKEAIKALGNKRRQMEVMADFGLASFGQEAVIRRFLDQLFLIEVPEEEKPLRELGMGWDDHVHDTLSEGRKTPTQVLLDAFIKGLSELTLVYSHLEQRGMIHEAISAGQLLGIKVNIGIEFSVGKSGNRHHYMYIPPITVDDSTKFFRFFEKRAETFAPFTQGLIANAQNRRRTMGEALERFNTTQRVKLNAGYEPDSPCYFPTLKIEELDRIVFTGQPSRTHLGELLYQKFREVFHRRALFLKAQVYAAEERFRRGIYSEWELKNLNSQYLAIREQYENMTPESLRVQYMDSREIVDYDSIFQSEPEILDLLRKEGGKILLIHPLESGLKESILYVLKHSAYITHVEAINLRDSVNRNPNDLIIFNQFVHILNNSSAEDLVAFLEQLGIKNIDHQFIRQTQANIEKRGIIPVCGSDSTGRDPTIPGMGFIRADKIPETVATSFIENHYKIPRPIADLVLNKGKDPARLNSEAIRSDIVCMGKIGKPYKNQIGDEENVEVISLMRFMTYLNPFLKNCVRTGVGYGAAFFWIGPEFAALWLAITFIRNVLVDLIAASGLNFKAYSHYNINFDNATQSLFWTGWSVPILTTVKSWFDNVWTGFYGTGTTGGPLFETVKFFCICLANGLYITSHNKLRHFDRKVIRANFFRSVLAWPFATAFSPIGNMLGLPSVVQAKIWSDVIAGVIEGSGKYAQRFRVRMRDVAEVLPKLDDHNRDSRLIAMLDVLYIWARQPRGNTALREILAQKRPFWKRAWKKPLTPEETKGAERCRHYHDRLLELFGDPGCLNNLTDFVLRHYCDREALILTELIGTYTESFLTWLKAFRPEVVPVKVPVARN